KRDGLIQRLHEENEKLFDKLTAKTNSVGSSEVDLFPDSSSLHFCMSHLFLMLLACYVFIQFFGVLQKMWSIFGLGIGKIKILLDYVNVSLVGYAKRHGNAIAVFIGRNCCYELLIIPQMRIGRHKTEFLPCCKITIGFLRPLSNDCITSCKFLVLVCTL
ncbi:hypothetical protein KSS87_010352, partial [Heliosperma pusillum]